MLNSIVLSAAFRNRVCLALGIAAALAIIFPGLGVCGDTTAVKSDLPKDNCPVYHLGEVIVVRANPLTIDVSQSQLSNIDMKAFGVSTVASAFSGMPGTVVTAGSKGESRLQLRGFQSQEIQVLIDGRPSNLPYYGDLDLTSIPISNISRIRILKGPVPSIYGANTMGGVVNIISQRVTDRPHRELRFMAGRDRTYQGVLNYGAMRGPLDYWLSLGLSSSDGHRLSSDYRKEPLEDGDLRYNSEYRHFNIDTKANYTLPGGVLISLSSGLYDAERGLPSGTDRPTFQHFPLWRRWYVDAGGDGRIGRNFVWRAKLYYDDCENRLQRYDDSLMVDTSLVFDSYHDSYDFGGNLNANFKLSPGLENTSGLTARLDAIRKQDDIGEPWLSGKIETYSAFTQFTLSPLSKLDVEAGVSLNLMAAYVIDALALSFDPYVSVEYRPLMQVKIRSAVSRASRFPTLNHLFSTESGNPELEYERALKVDLGYSIDLPARLTWSETFFLSDVDNLIDRRSKQDLYENIDDVELRGLESGIRVSRHRGFSLSLSHMYLHAKEYRSVAGVRAGARRPHSPSQKTDYSVIFAPDFGLEITHSGQYIADRIAPDGTSLPDYYLANLRLAQSIRAGMKMFVNVRNVLDKNYVEEKYYPMPGRTLALGVEVLF